jgi:hypothetical protein
MMWVLSYYPTMKTAQLDTPRFVQFGSTWCVASTLRAGQFIIPGSYPTEAAARAEYARREEIANRAGLQMQQCN